MLKTLKDQIQVLVDIVEHYNNIKKEVNRESLFHPTGDKNNILGYIKAEHFELFVEQLETIQSILEYNSPINNAQHLYLIEKAEAKLSSLPFGSPDWQRQYGYIEGLKAVEFYTRKDAI